MYAVMTGVLIPVNADVVLLGRIRSRGGAYITIATVTSIAWTLADLSDGSAQGVITSGTFTVATSIFDQLQVDTLWVKDALGYNFKGVIGGASVPTANGGHRLAADVKVTMATTGEILRGQFNWPTVKVWG